MGHTINLIISLVLEFCRIVEIKVIQFGKARTFLFVLMHIHHSQENMKLQQILM